MGDFQLKYEKLTSSLLKLDSLRTVNFHIKMLAYTFAIVHYLPRDIFNIEKKNLILQIIKQFFCHNCDVTKYE